MLSFLHSLFLFFPFSFLHQFFLFSFHFFSSSHIASLFTSLFYSLSLSVSGTPCDYPMQSKLHQPTEFTDIGANKTYIKHRYNIYWVTQRLQQIYTANHATFPIRIRKITVQICDNFWVTQNNRM